MRVKAHIIFPVIFFGLVACKKEAGHENSSKEISFFDLKGLVNKDIKDLSARSCGIERTVVADGKPETHMLAAVNFETELQPLLDCDLNKSGWKDKFITDTTTGPEGDKVIRYTSVSDRVNIKSMNVYMGADGQVKKVAIKKEIRSFTFSYNSSIVYFPGQGYKILTSQKAFLIHTFAMQVQAKFSCK